MSQRRTRSPIVRRAVLWVALACCVGPASGCLLMPNRGTPVFVEARTGDYWSGKGLLLEVSEDQTRCLVAARDRALVVHKRWIPCTAVHAQRRQ